MQPWHIDVRLTENFAISDGLGYAHRQRERAGDVAFYSPRRFLDKLDAMYPDGMQGKRFLDAGCNNGAYCFLAAERGVEQAKGLEIRHHWLKQAQFIRKNFALGDVSEFEFDNADVRSYCPAANERYDFVHFSGIFHHLPDPIAVLQKFAALTDDILLLNTASKTGLPDGYLSCAIEGVEEPVSGVHYLSWYPTGPKVLATILHWAGFHDIRLSFVRETNAKKSLGRIEIIAGRDAGRLDCFDSMPQLAGAHPPLTRCHESASSPKGDQRHE